MKKEQRNLNVFLHLQVFTDCKYPTDHVPCRLVFSYIYTSKSHSFKFYCGKMATNTGWLFLYDKYQLLETNLWHIYSCYQY